MAATLKQFEDFFRETVNDVYRYAYYKTNDRESAEDITSEAYWRMLSSKKWEDLANKKAWLIGITRNIIYETYRDKPKGSDDIIDEESLPESTELDIETEAVNAEMVQLLKKKLDKVDEETREVIVLRVWDELQFGEIAQIVGDKESTVKLRFYRGIEKLKKLINSDKNAVKFRSMGLPLLLGAVSYMKQEPELLPSAEFSLRLDNLLDTQFMDVPKPDPIRKPEPVPNTATAQPVVSDMPKLDIHIPWQTKLKANVQHMFTPQFAMPLLAYSIGAMLIVGATAILSTNAVVGSISSQPSPEVRRLDAALPEEEEEVVDPTANWSSYTDTRLGISLKYPKDLEANAIEGTKYSEILGDIAVPKLELKDDSFTLNFILAEPDESFTIAGFGDPDDSDTDFPVITVLGADKTFTVARYGEGFPAGTDGCDYAGYLVKMYYMPLDKGVHAYFQFEFGTECGRNEDPDAEARILEQIAPYKETIIEIFKSIEPVAITKTIDPFKDWKTFDNSSITMRYPANWTATTPGNANEMFVTFGSEKSILSVSLGQPGFGLGPSESASRQVKMLFGTKVVDATEYVLDDCLDVDDCDSTESIPFEEWDWNRGGRAFLYFDTGVNGKNSAETYFVSVFYDFGETITGSDYSTYITSLQTINKILSSFVQK